MRYLTNIIFSICLAAANMAFADTFVQNGETRLFCKVIGKGSPLVVLHGGPGMSQVYLLPYMEELAKTHQVIFYDQRGCGQSEGSVNKDTISLAHFIDDIEAIRKHFAIKKITLVGHSWGGHLAMNYAVSHPEMVDKLVLINSTPATSSGFALFIKEWMRRQTSVIAEINKMKESQAFFPAQWDPKLGIHVT